MSFADEKEARGVFLEERGGEKKVNELEKWELWHLQGLRATFK